MALVNSNLSAVTDALRNIRTAASGIETTRQLITQKYAQLGTGWNDRKYRELGLILTDCMKALMSILQILRQAEQPVSMLIESVRQYEEVNLGGGSGGGGGQYAGEGAAALVPPGTRAPGERERLLRGSLASIDQVIENYRQSLERRGLAQGFVMDMVLNRERFRLEADALRTLDGDFSQPTPDRTPEDLDGIIRDLRREGLLYSRGSAPPPRALQTSVYGFTTQEINGAEMRVYDDPVGTFQQLIRNQANSHYTMEGTCGLCQCANLLTMAGVPGASEDLMISAALHSSEEVMESLDVFNSDYGNRGGTTAADRQEILSRCGLQTYLRPIESSESETMRGLAEAVETGHGVILSVDVARLWQNGQRGGHAISLLSVSEDGSTFIYSDTGAGCMGTISSHDLFQALTGRPANITTNIIR